MAARALRVAEEAGTAPVLALRYRAEEVLAALSEEAPELLSRSAVVLPAGRELAESFRMGVGRAVECGATRIAVLLVDQPGIGAAALTAALQGHTPGGITRGAVNGRPGHPVVFDSDEAVAAASHAVGDEGARRYLRAHADRVSIIDLSAVADDFDLDTPADLFRLR